MGWLQDRFGRLKARSQPGGSVTPAPEPVDWRVQGNAALAAGDLAKAAHCYEKGIAADPGDASLRLNHGYVLLEQGETGAAAERLQQALALRRPGDDFVHEAQYLLGRACAQRGQVEQALAHWAEAAAERPDFAEPLEEAVRLLAGAGRHAEAAEWAQRLAALRPDAASQLLLARELAACGRQEAALSVVDRVCASDPRNVEASVQRFEWLLGAGRAAEALAESQRTLALTGPHPGALANVAAALERLGRADEALARLDQALQLAPDHAGALASRVTLLTRQLRLREAVATAQSGLAAHPHDADLHWNLALAHLLGGEFEPGWREHEWRLQVPSLQHKVLRVDAPPWGGESLAGRAILLHGEQGFGDNIQFVRFVPRVAAGAAQVFLRIDAALQPLLRGTLPANVTLLPAGAPLPAVDCHAPLMSLPAILGLEERDFSPRMPYLQADAGAVQAWRARLPGGVLRVGAAWAGNPTHANDHNRSMSLATFLGVQAEGCHFFTVQPKLPPGDSEALAAGGAIADTGRELRDFAQTAALVEALDLVVTVDTAVAHLAGALGKPVWILLPHAPDWRWLLGRSDSPWYPSARLYRQPTAGDWSPVLAQVKSDLRTLAQRR